MRGRKTKLTAMPPKPTIGYRVATEERANRAVSLAAQRSRIGVYALATERRIENNH